jgi:Flp pilus assembly protein TadD
LSLLDYLWDIVQEVISKLPLPLPSKIILALIFVVLVLFYLLNKKLFDKWLEDHRKKLNFLFKLILLILILSLVASLIVGTFYFPKPPEDQLVVAISPFYYVDESGQPGSDINTATDLKERIEAEKGLGIRVIMLDNPIRDTEEAKLQGKKVGAHLVVYGETKKKIGNVGEVEYFILPLSSLEVTTPEIPFLKDMNEGEDSQIITETATFSMVTEEPIKIIELLTENASSAIYTIGAFENYKKSNFSSAISFFEAIKDYEKNPLILFYIAVCHYWNNNLNKSLLYLDKAIEINPQFPEAWNSKGVALGDLGRYEDALIAFDKAIEINPQSPEAWYNKGLALSYLGRNEDALIAFDKAIEINPQFPEAWTNKGNALGDLGRYEDALIAFDKAIEINPQFADAWYNKGVDLAYLGRYGDAREAFEKAHEIDPTIEIPDIL